MHSEKFVMLFKRYTIFPNVSLVSHNEISAIRNMLLLLANNIGARQGRASHLKPLLKNYSSQAEKFVILLAKNKAYPNNIDNEKVIEAK